MIHNGNGHGGLRVLMTADCVGGVWTYCMELIEALAEDRIEVGLAVMGGALSDEQRTQAEALPNLRLFKSTLRLEWMPEPWTDIDKAGAWLLEIEAAFRPHVIHLNQFCFGNLPWRAPAMVVGHSCVYSWWQAVHGTTPPPEWETYYQRVCEGLLGATRVVAPGYPMLQSLIGNYLSCTSTATVQVIHNGRNPHRFAPRDKREEVLCAGRIWDEAKNLKLLEPVAQRLSWPVRVAGPASGPHGQAVSLEGLEPLGYLGSEALAAAMGEATIFAHPAKYEPFGLAPLEAGLSGCALVLGDIPSLREIWRDCAIYADVENAEAWHRALESLIADPARREAYGQRARARALEFSARRMAQHYRHAYYQLCCRQAELQREVA